MLVLCSPASPSPCGQPPLLTAAQRMDVDGQLFDRLWIETMGPGRHHSPAAITDGFHHRRLVACIEPKLVREVGRTELLIPLSIGAVTRRAIVGEDLRSPVRGRLVVGLARE